MTGYGGRVPFDNTRAKALAAVSEADADVKRLEAELSSAQTKLKLMQTSDSAVDKITNIPVVKDNTEFLRKKTEAEVAAAQAEVDRVESELATARTKLKWSQRALSTVDTVNDTVADLQAGAQEALADDSAAPVTAASPDVDAAPDPDQPGDAKA